MLAAMSPPSSSSALATPALLPDIGLRAGLWRYLPLGTVVALPFESTFVIQSLYATEMRTDVQTLGLALGELCPDESLMVTGISHDWAYSDSGISRMFVGDAFEEAVFKNF